MKKFLQSIILLISGVLSVGFTTFYICFATLHDYWNPKDVFGGVVCFLLMCILVGFLTYNIWYYIIIGESK